MFSGGWVSITVLSLKIFKSFKSGVPLVLIYVEPPNVL